jgi:PAS domain S-box-containing protein
MTIRPSERRNVLIVDDDPTVLDLLVELLEQEGYCVKSARDGRGALEIISSSAPDIVISDVLMPVMDGFQLCRLIKQDPQTANIPILLVSGIRKSDEDSLEGLTAGADDYLEIPFRHEELLVKVARLSERRCMEQALKESEERYRRLVELSPEAIVVESGGKLVYVNPAAQKLWGAASAEELIGKPALEFIHPDYHDLVLARTRQIRMAGADSPPLEGKFVRLDGQVIDVEVRSMPFKFNGEPAIQVVIDDITERKRMESERQVIFEIIQGVIATSNLDELLRLIHESIKRILYAENCFVALHDPITDILHFEFWVDKFDPVPPPRPVGKGFSSYLLRTGQPILLTRDDAEQMYARGEVERSGTSSALWLGVPLRTPSRIIGALVVQHYEDEHAYDKRDLEFLTSVGSQIALAIERKRAEAALRESEHGYRELFENANDIIYTHDLAGNFTSLNRTGEVLTGYSREEAKQMNISDVLAPESLAIARQMLAQKALLNAPTVYELEIIAKDGHRVRLEVSTRNIYKDQNPVGVQGIARDLTDRRRSEAALQESQAFFHSFMNNSPAIAFMKDEAGRYVYVNEPFERVFGHKLNFLRGKTSFDWLPETAARKTHENDLEVLSNGKSQEIIEIVPMVDGSTHDWLVFKFPMTDGAGRRFVAGVGVDITDRRRAQEALSRQAEREALTHVISQAVRRSLDASEIFRTAVNELGSHLNVDRCSLYMKDARRNRAVMVAEFHASEVEPAGKDFDLPSLTRLIQALDQKGVLAFDDAARDERIAELYHRLLSKANVRSIMYVAIRVGDDVPAAFVLSTTRVARHWTEADRNLARAIADQTGIAIRQAQLYQKAEATSVREALANRLSLAIRASLSLPEVLNTATHELGLALSASCVHLHLYDPADPVSPAEYEYFAAGSESGDRLDLSYDDPIGWCLKNESKPIVIDDAFSHCEGSDEFRDHIRSQAENLQLRSKICYPLMVKGAFRGTLCINQTDRVRHWSEDELALVESVAAQLATGMAQAELFEMVARGKQEWEITFDAMSDGIFIFDRAGRLKRVNQAGASMEKATPQRLLGRKCCDILRTNTEDESCVVERALSEAASVTIEITPVRLKRPLLVTIEAVLDKSNKPVAAVCTARDLSELRKAEAVAREHQSLLTNILESARESIYAVDSQGRFQWCNNATLRGLGFKREEFIGRNLLEMIYEADRLLVSEKLAGALRGEPQTYEMRYFARDGRLRYARVDNSPLIVDGRTTGVLGIARDITGQKEERERAARADKLRALGQLASGVAHDFNNSLAAILGRAQLLRRQTRDNSLLRNVDIIQTAAQDAAATVRRIQTFARKSSAKEFELVDVRSLLNDAIEITRTRWHNEARLRGLNYDVRLEALNGLLTNGSASELREVFVNLIVNAVDAMPRGGQLLISGERDNERLKLCFADTGSGIPDDVREKIFEPFFSTKGAQGTGLGLSVSYSIIERHDGLIRVESEEGQGTTFVIDLPAVETQAQETDSDNKLQSSAPLSILVVDDEPSVRETLADMLSILRHKVAQADSGHAALRKLASESFDLVFTDLAMPEMDGWETARAIRKRWPEISVVLVTGYGASALPPSGQPGLVDAVIGKPFDFSQIDGVIAQLSLERTWEPSLAT